MDIVYILGTGSVWEDNELRYSLRSVAANVRDVRDVYVVGERPFFLQGVRHIAVPDPYPEKWRNAYFKIATACSLPELSDEFLLMNDDFFINAPLDAATFPYFFRGRLRLGRVEGKPESWTTWQQTAELLTQSGKTVLNYAVHCPFRYRKENFLRMPIATSVQGHYSVRAFYGNFWRVGGTDRNDQILTPLMPAESMKKFVEGKTDFSIMSRVARTQAFRNFIGAHFPNPSKYEKGG